MNIYEQQPPLVSTAKTLRDYITYFNLEARELTQEEREANEIPETIVDEQGNETPREAWTAHTVIYRHEHPLTEDDYGKMVAAIVRSKYTADDVEAIMNNYMQDFSSESEQEFEEMQAWRDLAKKTACEVLGGTPSTNYAPSLSELVGQLKTLLRKEVQQLPDEEAMNVPSLFDEWSPGITVEAGERRYFAKELYKCVQGHTTQSDWKPNITPALWTKVSVEEWPQWVQPTGAHDAYNTGDKVTFEGNHYVSLINGNVWSPTAYPAGWQLEP